MADERVETWRERMRRHGRPRVTRGTLPTPDSPDPSNKTIRQYPDGSVIISTGPPTERVLAEYAAAVAEHSDSAALRLQYAYTLHRAKRNEDAVAQLEAAVRLEPASDDAHILRAGCLKELGRADEAVRSASEALRLVLADPRAGEDREALTRWGLAECLAAAGRTADARAELQRAVELQRSFLARGRGSQQLLGQLEREAADLG